MLLFSSLAVLLGLLVQMKISISLQEQENFAREIGSIYSNLLNKKGKTAVNINFLSDDKNFKFRLKNDRDLDRKSLNFLRKREISSTIS